MQLLNNLLTYVDSEKMLTSSVKADVISFFVTRKCQKLDEN